MEVEQLARLCHDAMINFNLWVMNEYLADWDLCEQWMRDDTISSVKMILRTKEDDVTYNMLHDYWVEMKEDAGWVYGEITDRPNKIHNCMVDFEDLTPEEQAKDKIFVDLCMTYKPFIEDI